MQYFFIAGSNRGLSFAEIQTLFAGQYGTDKIEIDTFKDVLLIKFKSAAPSDSDMKIWFDRLGGVVKFGRIVEDQDKFLEETADKFNNAETGSIRFGISFHGKLDRVEDPFGGIKKLSKKVKKYLKSHGVKSGYTLPQKGSSELSSAQIFNNSLTEDGFELVLISQQNSDKLLAGVTLGVQNIEDFSFRDFKKPAVDTVMGMLPLKLARIMVNLADVEPGETIWDPFCGSGTVLMEALHLGYNVLGSDFNNSAVVNSKTNIEWMGEHYALDDSRYRVFDFDISDPDGKIVTELKHTTISAVVCEPYMGPPQKTVIPNDEAEEQARKFGFLIENLFDLLENLRQETLKVVLVVPSYKTRNGWVNVSLNSVISSNWNIVSSDYIWDLQWSRKNSIIKRNIMVLELDK
ncbi:hypothetical protein GF357_00465 [Candidatus Dojkabacteria bacterium]|nr:hypothetical protein [Candidatus Dojkabacteria bacterium]